MSKKIILKFKNLWYFMKVLKPMVFYEVLKSMVFYGGFETRGILWGF